MKNIACFLSSSMLFLSHAKSSIILICCLLSTWSNPSGKSPVFQVSFHLFIFYKGGFCLCKTNNNRLLNLEMQVKNEYNWADRSLTYLCRAFDQLQEGQDYEETLPVIHIGFTDFTLFPDNPEFYATYRMININNHSQVYSDKFTLSVVDLTQIEKATEEDKASKIDYWARLFKAQTWEELQMLAQNDEYLQAAATSIRLANEKEIVREQCRAREDALRRERTLERDNKILLQQKQALQDEIASLRKQLDELKGHKL